MKIREKPRLIGRSVALTLCLGCADPVAQSPNETAQLPRDGAAYFPAATWRSAAPAQVGMDGARLDALVARIERGQVPGLHGLVVVRHGYVVVERYFNGSGATRAHTVQSVTKSVTSLVVGIAADDGKLSAESRVFDLLPQYASLAAGDARKRAVTVGSLLEMRSGIDFYESPYANSPLQRLNDSRDDWARLALAEPMNAAPGERWQYNSGGPIALAAAVQQATGRRFADYARERLFAPLGVTSERWAVSPYDGLPHTGGGLSLTATDLARVGYLVLRGGRWGDRQVVSARWLAESTRPRTVRNGGFAGVASDYGYLWWLLPSGAGDDVVYTASGNLNNWLFVAPKHDLVVAVIGQNNDAGPVPVDLLFREIIPAIVLP